MKFIKLPFLLLLLLALLPCIAVPADAALISITSSGNGIFVLRGDALSDVHTIDALISYDTATLANPRVVQGGLISGAMMVANPNYSQAVVGVFVVSGAKAIAGSGVLATITFDRLGGSAGKILSLNPVLGDVNGARFPAPQTQINNPPETVAQETKNPPQTDTTRTTTETTTTTTAGTGQGYTAPGTITIPGEAGDPPKQNTPQEIIQEKAVAEAKGGEADKSAPETVPEEKSADAQPTKAPPEPKNVVYPTVLERFHEFNGEKTSKSLTALFDAAAIPGVRQEPAVVLTDGKTRVKVTIQSLSTGKETPNFALQGAKLISLKQEGDAWVIEALPDSKGYEAGITVLHNGSSTEIPLVIAPPLAADSAADEAGFIIFLKERGTDKAPRHDLNGDGVRTYLDDYIFTANFIVKRDSITKAPLQKQMIR